MNPYFDVIEHNQQVLQASGNELTANGARAIVVIGEDLFNKIILSSPDYVLKDLPKLITMFRILANDLEKKHNDNFIHKLNIEQ